MSEMIDRVARVIADNFGALKIDDVARKVIEAIGEPTAAMTEAAARSAYEAFDDDWRVTQEMKDKNWETIKSLAFILERGRLVFIAGIEEALK